MELGRSVLSKSMTAAFIDPTGHCCQRNFGISSKNTIKYLLKKYIDTHNDRIYNHDYKVNVIIKMAVSAGILLHLLRTALVSQRSWMRRKEF